MQDKIIALTNKNLTHKNCDACRMGVEVENYEKLHECCNYGKPVAGLTTTVNRHMSLAELKLGDVVNSGLPDDPWSTAVVVQVTDTEITFFRPYAMTSDYSHTGGVTPSMGAERWTRSREKFPTLFVYSRKVVV